MTSLNELFYGKENTEQMERFKALEKEIFDKHKDFFEENNIDPKYSTTLQYDGKTAIYEITDELVKNRMESELRAAFSKVFPKNN
tara:strand:- start:6497 stop:6751 length:255 start_codon:yes stop_codon:yes gene_type:complete